jgi:outer membrane protein, heavy metal efflux system
LLYPYPGEGCANSFPAKLRQENASSIDFDYPRQTSLYCIDFGIPARNGRNGGEVSRLAAGRTVAVSIAQTRLPMACSLARMRVSGHSASLLSQRAITFNSFACPAFLHRSASKGPRLALPVWVIVAPCLVALRSLYARMISIRWIGWALLMLFLAASPSAPAQTPGVPLTLQQAIALARTKNPNLLSGQQHVIATRASEVTAGLRQNPSLTLGGTDVTLPANNPGNPYSYSANLSRLFERGQKRRWRLDLAHSTTDVTQSQYQDTERQTIFAVKQSFTQMLAAKAGLKIADDNLQSYRKTVDLSKQRLNAGDISATDFDRIELQLAEFEADYDSANLNLEQSTDQLKMLLGIETAASGFDITGTLDAPQLTLTEADVEQRALAERPDYRAAQQSLRVAEANVKLAQAYGTTDPTVAGEYDRSGNDNSGGFQVNIPLRIFDRNQGEKERTRYEAQSTRFAEIAARNQVINDVDQAWAGYQTALRQSQRYNGHYLAQASRVRDNLEFSYRHGGSTLLDYLDALRDYRQVNLDALNANVQVWLGLHQLSYVAASEMVP